MRTTPIVIFNLKQASSTTRWRKTLAQKKAMTWWQEFTRNSLTAPPVHLQESRKRTVLTVSRNSAVRIPLRRFRQTIFCWPFRSGQTTTILQISITTLPEFPNCQSHSRQRCKLSTVNMRKLSYLKIFSKRGSKSIINWLKMTESSTSILSWAEMTYKHLKTKMAQPERISEKPWQFSEGNT